MGKTVKITWVGVEQQPETYKWECNTTYPPEAYPEEDATELGQITQTTYRLECNWVATEDTPATYKWVCEDSSYTGDYPSGNPVYENETAEINVPASKHWVFDGSDFAEDEYDELNEPTDNLEEAEIGFSYQGSGKVPTKYKVFEDNVDTSISDMCTGGSDTMYVNPLNNTPSLDWNGSGSSLYGYTAEDDYAAIRDSDSVYDCKLVGIMTNRPITAEQCAEELGTLTVKFSLLIEQTGVGYTNSNFTYPSEYGQNSTTDAWYVPCQIKESDWYMSSYDAQDTLYKFGFIWIDNVEGLEYRYNGENGQGWYNGNEYIVDLPSEITSYETFHRREFCIVSEVPYSINSFPDYQFEIDGGQEINAIYDDENNELTADVDIHYILEPSYTVEGTEETTVYFSADIDTPATYKWTSTEELETQTKCGEPNREPDNADDYDDTEYIETFDWTSAVNDQAYLEWVCQDENDYGTWPENQYPSYDGEITYTYKELADGGVLYTLRSGVNNFEAFTTAVHTKWSNPDVTIEVGKWVELYNQGKTEDYIAIFNTGETAKIDDFEF